MALEMRQQAGATGRGLSASVSALRLTAGVLAGMLPAMMLQQRRHSRRSICVLLHTPAAGRLGGPMLPMQLTRLRAGVGASLLTQQHRMLSF